MTDWIVPYLARGSVYGPEELAVLQGLFEGEASLSCGDERDRFEEEFAAAIGANHAIALTNCTVALEFATKLIGLEPGDEVIAVSQTYHATVQPLLDLDVTVRFCDIDAGTLNLDLPAVEALIGPRTRAVYLVHHGGRCCDLDGLEALSSRHGLRIVEDCAHALPSRQSVRHAGTLDLGCFSFQSYKNISTLGEGGMLTTRNPNDAQLARIGRAIEPWATYADRPGDAIDGHRLTDRRIFWHHRESFNRDCVDLSWAGTNSTLAEPACAVGRVQLTRLHDLAAKRAAIARRYDEALGQADGVQLLDPVPPDDVHSHHLYSFRLLGPPGRRDALLSAAIDAGIEIQQRYFPVHMMPEWRVRSDGGSLPVTERTWFEELVQLPIYPQLRDDQIEHVIESVLHALGQARLRSSLRP